MSHLSHLTSTILALPIEDRIELAQALWSSVHDAPVLDASSESAVLDEAEARIADMESGKEREIPYADVMAEARRALKCR